MCACKGDLPEQADHTEYICQFPPLVEPTEDTEFITSDEIIESFRPVGWPWDWEND